MGADIQLVFRKGVLFPSGNARPGSKPTTAGLESLSAEDDSLRMHHLSRGFDG